MNRVLKVDLDASEVTVEPGVVLEQLNRHLASTGRQNYANRLDLIDAGVRRIQKTAETIEPNFSLDCASEIAHEL